MVDSRLHHIIMPLLFIAVAAAAVYRSLKNIWSEITAH
jgi:hypothetical protein